MSNFLPLWKQNSLCLSLGLDVTEHCLKVIFGSLGRDEVQVVPLKRRKDQGWQASSHCSALHYRTFSTSLNSAIFRSFPKRSITARLWIRFALLSPLTSNSSLSFISLECLSFFVSLSHHAFFMGEPPLWKWDPHSRHMQSDPRQDEIKGGRQGAVSLCFLGDSLMAAHN